MADVDDDPFKLPDPAPTQADDDNPMSESDRQLRERLTREIRLDKEHHQSAYKRMRKSMEVAWNGYDRDDWSDKLYSANICGRHVKMKTAALYAKNPKAVARRRETIDFTVWDENEQSLMLAFQTMQQAQQMAQPAVVDMKSGALVPQEPQLPPGFEQAQAVIVDFQQGMQRRQQIQRVSRTLEILFAHALREQKPLDFKKAAKNVVRRALTTGVGYVEIGFQRVMGPSATTGRKLADAQTRLEHLRNLAAKAESGDLSEDDPEIAELEHSVTALEAEPEIVLREGLVFDFPQSTRVVPDRLCRSLVGFEGARHLTVEYLFTKDEIAEKFEVDLKNSYTPYRSDGRSAKDTSQPTFWDKDDSQRRGDLACVWKYYDKPSGLVYYLCDGYGSFLKPPAPPDIYVEDFWPVYALTFNSMESEDELFPRSDVELLTHQQREHNRSRQGKREHRDFARPRFVTPKGLLEEEDKKKLGNAAPFSVSEIAIDPNLDINKVLYAVQAPGVDPNLYDVNEVWMDAQLVAGVQEAQLGGTSKSTATEAAIASGATSLADSSSVDELDGWLTDIARSSGQIMMKEMSADQVMQIVGPGCAWPEQTLSDLASELFLEVEAGSTGRPNQAAEINNWKQMLPFLIQMPTIRPVWLARETLRRLDDKLDLTDALVDSMPAIVAQNRAQPVPPDAEQDPAAQGSEGGDKTPAAPGESGTGAAFGSNQV